MHKMHKNAYCRIESFHVLRQFFCGKFKLSVGSGSRGSQLLECMFVGVKKLTPVTALMSSTWGGYSARWCINGKANDSYQNICNSKAESAPWLALDYGKGERVFVEKVFLYNRNDKHAGRTKNVQIRLSNELPASGKRMFSGGQFLGSFKGPARRRQTVEIHSRPGWGEKNGRYLIIQMNMGSQPNFLNLKEAYAVGFAKGKKKKLFHIYSYSQEGRHE